MTSAWRNRIVGSGTEAPDQLVANPLNWREHPPAQREALRGSLNTVGWVQQVLVNRVTGNVVDGHARVEEALSRQESEVPVLYVELSPEEEATVLATLDPISAMATTNDERLTELLADVNVDDAGLQRLLDDLAGVKVKAGLTDPDEVPAVAEEPYVKAGELWLLGDHRLLCGDATKAEDAKRLGPKGALMYADPPYGMALDADFTTMIGIGQGKRYDNLIGDQEPFDPSHLFALYQAPEVILWGADYYAERLPSRNDGSWFVWDKMGAEGPNDNYDKMFGSNFELAWSQQRHKRALVRVLWKGIFGLSAEDTKARVHPTQKPTELARWFIERFTKTTDVVLDPYLGSGSTLIAAEQLGRRCYAMEIDPRYVQVAIERWQAFTGKEAQRAQ